jgi:hypothetical protein
MQLRNMANGLRCLSGAYLTQRVYLGVLRREQQVLSVTSSIHPGEALAVSDWTVTTGDLHWETT